MSAQRTQLPDGRWHFQHGPMDIVLGAEGTPAAVDHAHAQAWARFAPLLDELVAELPQLRQPVHTGPCPLHGGVAQRMWHACAPYRAEFITPMAAVAGAVAQELVACYAHAGVVRAWANNGGDIALHLPSAESAVRIGLYADLARLRPEDVRDGVPLDGKFSVTHTMPVRGVATSGWRGRSFSRGIADSVTVLAHTAAQADAAATFIANAVDVADGGIVRKPASALKDGSDLGEILVTVEVPPLGPDQVQQALAAGAQRARVLQAAGLVWSAVLVCQGRVVVVEAAADLLVLDGTGHRLDPQCAQVGSVFA